MSPPLNWNTLTSSVETVHHQKICIYVSLYLQITTNNNEVILWCNYSFIGWFWRLKMQLTVAWLCLLPKISYLKPKLWGNQWLSIYVTVTICHWKYRFWKSTLFTFAFKILNWPRYLICVRKECGWYAEIRMLVTRQWVISLAVRCVVCFFSV